MVKRAKTARQNIIDPRTSPYAGVGLVWEVVGSRGDTYKIRLEPYGFQCQCTGFQMRRDCRHVAQVDELLGGDHDDPVYQIPEGIWNERSS